MRCCGGLRVHAVAAAGDHHRCRAGVGGTLASEDDAPEDLTEEQLARSAARRFNDVDVDDYYAAAVGWMLAFEITTGCTGDSFCAHDLATRRHFVTFLWRAAGSPKPEQAGRSCSPTSKPATTPTTPLAGTFEQGVTVGCGANDDDERLFCPSRNATRAHISTFIYRYTGAEEEPDDTFADVDPEAYFSAPVAWMRAHGLTTGCAADDDGRLLFCPGENATRAHVAAFLYRTATTPESWGENGGILRPAPEP